MNYILIVKKTTFLSRRDTTTFHIPYDFYM